MLVQLLGNNDDEVEEVTAKVEVMTLDSEVSKIKKSRETSAGGSANPFAGTGTDGSNFGPFGGLMGRLGGILGKLKSMWGGIPAGM